ncbi:MAG: glycosyl transferase family 6 [Dysgonamonadaceae bacterium]|jgi:hypothetical protein|nr:glycosyl transferase family 6 [Dysgonamonadaceae bacterium]
MNIGILYICTGNYTIFWNDFYLSCEKKFFPGKERYYFVFTDGNINTFGNPNVQIIHQPKLGWPYDTLMRFKMFIGIEDKLRQTDYLFFFNANMIVKEPVGEEILPSDDEELVVAMHPTYFMETDPDKYSYDRNPESLAYIPIGEGKEYVQGAFNGGKSEKFLTMCRILDDNTDKDLSRNVIALWHDESHLNRYILDKHVKVLHPGYIYPEGRDLPFEMIMYTRKKKKYGGHNVLRGIKRESFFSRLNKFFRRIVRRKSDYMTK